MSEEAFMSKVVEIGKVSKVTDKATKEAKNTGADNYFTIRQYLTPFIKEGGHSVDELTKKGVKFARENKLDFGSNISNLIAKEIRISTRPTDHWKNRWGFNACVSKADKTFSVKNYKDKHGVKVHTMKSYKDAHNGVNKYEEYSQMHKENTKDFGYASREYKEVMAKRRAEAEAQKKAKAEAKKAVEQKKAEAEKVNTTKKAKPTTKTTTEARV